MAKNAVAGALALKVDSAGTKGIKLMGLSASAFMPPGSALLSVSTPKSIASHSNAMASAIHFGDANSGFQAGNINGPVNTEFHHHAPAGELQRAQPDRR
jgi:hypothetical protein